MICALAIALVATQSSAALDVSEYFPLTPGSTWRYLFESEGVNIHFTSTVRDSVTYEDGTVATPITSVFGASGSESTYYDVTANAVSVVSFSKDIKLPSMYIILQSPDIGEKWTIRATTAMLGASAEMNLIGKVKKLKSRRFDGKSVEVLEVTLEGTIVEFGGILTETKQVAVYGKGIGLLEMKQDSKTGEMKTSTKMTLEDYFPGKS